MRGTDPMRRAFRAVGLLVPAVLVSGLMQVSSAAGALTGRATALALCRDKLAWAWYRAGVDSFEVSGSSVARGLTYVRVRQLWHDLPVLGADGTITLDSTDRPILSLAHFVPAPAPPGSFRLQRPEALARALTAAGSGGVPSLSEAEPCVWSDSSGAKLAWQVSAKGPFEAPTVVTVDANTGAILGTGPAAMNAVGLSYPNDPRDALMERPLPGLLGDGSRLQNAWYQAQNMAGPNVARPGGDFRIPPAGPDTTGFDEVNAYAHAQDFLHVFLAHLGYTGAPDTIIVRVHAPLSPSVAQTVYPYVSLGDSVAGFTHDAAKATDVIVHELMHAVTWGFGVTPAGPRREALALHEGISDYMAAAFTGDPAIGEWLYLPYPNGATRVDQPASVFKYSNYDQLAFGAAPTGSQWANGMILSGALWDLRTAIGPTADSLVMEALPALPSQPMWSDFAEALRVAGYALHGAGVGAAVVQALTNRGITGQASLSIQGPTDLQPGVAGHFSASSAATLETPPTWSVRQYCGSVPCGGWVTVGSGMTLDYGDTLDFTLRAVAFSWGVPATDSITVYVRPPTVVISGPAWFLRSQRVTYSPIAFGEEGLSYQWWSKPLGNLTETPLAKTFSVQFNPTTTFDLHLRVTDGVGRFTDARMRVSMLRPLIAGSNYAIPGAPTTFSVTADSLGPTASILWEQRRFCGSSLCPGGWLPVGTTRQLSLADSLDYTLRVTVRQPTGSSGADSLIVAADSLFIYVVQPAVAIAGPSWCVAGGPVHLSVQTTASDPWTVLWWSRRTGSTGLWSIIGTGHFVDFTPDTTTDVYVNVTDAFGRSAVTETRIHSVRTSLAGPSDALPGQAAHYAAVFDTTIQGTVITWAVTPWCGSGACGGVAEQSFAGPAIDLAEPTDFRVRMTATFPDGSSVTDSLLVGVQVPTVKIVNRIAGAAPGSRVFRSTVSGVGALATSWFLTPGASGGSEWRFGAGDSLVVAMAAPYRVRTTVTDYRGRIATDAVLVTADGRVLAVSDLSRAGLYVVSPVNGELRATLQLPGSGDARLVLYDLAGRVVATLWDGAAPVPSRTISRRVTGLAAGVYFCRLEWPGGMLGARVVLLP